MESGLCGGVGGEHEQLNERERAEREADVLFAASTSPKHTR